MPNKKNTIKISAGLLMMMLLAAPPSSYADWGFHRDDGHFFRYHDHPHFGLHLHFLPHGYFTIWVGRSRYYYYDGLYYNYVGGDYVLVSPPVGAMVSTIPSDFQPVVINGATYYADNGTYYLYTSHGYQVVPAPAMVVQPAAPPAPVVAAAVETQDSFTVNVPNNSAGGYTAVLIKKSGNGFVGPQGEFYPGFPKVAQLKAMYGK